jgi:DNA-binding response OmpR family regulator
MSRILIIDDDVILCRLLTELLTEEGFEVATVSFALEGFRMATENPPDLILLDIMLPDETGFQTCGKLRRHLQTRGIPIIMMSNSGGLLSQQAVAHLMGANDFLPKPLNVIELGDKVHGLLGSKPRHRGLVITHEPARRAPQPEAYREPRISSEYRKVDLLPASAKLFDDPAY